MQSFSLCPILIGITTVAKPVNRVTSNYREDYLDCKRRARWGFNESRPRRWFKRAYNKAFRKFFKHLPS